MRVDDLFPPEIIDEDIRKMMGGAALGAAMLTATPASAPAEAPSSVSQKEATVLAQTIWGEARSHGEEGMRAVGHVVLNRAQSGHPRLFGSGVIGAATKDKQFSCWNPGDPNRDRMAHMTEIDQQIRSGLTPDGTPLQVWMKTGEGQEYSAWIEAKRIARSILAGKSSDPTGGALFYHTTAVHPKWSARMTPIGQIANHIFYRGPDA